MAESIGEESSSANEGPSSVTEGLSSATRSVFDALKAPALSDLTRKRSVHCNPPPKGKRRARGEGSSEPKSITASQRMINQKSGSQLVTLIIFPVIARRILLTLLLKTNVTIKFHKSGQHADNNANSLSRDDTKSKEIHITPAASSAGVNKPSPMKQSSGGKSTSKKRSTRKKRSTTEQHELKPKSIYNVSLTHIYMLRLNVSFNRLDSTVTKFAGKLVVKMKNKHGYLSSLDYPMWQLYAGLVGVYSFYALIWLIMMAMNWTDLIRIQYWIGAVIALGMVEKCVSFSAYDELKETGSLSNLYIFAQLVSCLKRTLARILVIVVSTGFGIVKPRLGPMLNKLAAVGLVYFMLCSLAGYFDATAETVGDENNEVIANIPILVMDAGICYWIALSLTGTMRALRVRQNLVKLSLYRHFTVAILGSVAISIVFLVWSLYVFNSGNCVTDWHEIWLKDGFWHILFCFLLLIIMIIWRPGNNAARYAYSPVSDVDTEELEQLPSDAFEGMRLRDMKPDEEKEKQRNSTTAEDDLKWVEEHIPSGVDAALPSLLDSDEELMTTKFEMSKLD